MPEDCQRRRGCLSWGPGGEEGSVKEDPGSRHTDYREVKFCFGILVIFHMSGFLKCFTKRCHSG